MKVVPLKSAKQAKYLIPRLVKIIMLLLTYMHMKIVCTLAANIEIAHWVKKRPERFLNYVKCPESEFSYRNGLKTTTICPGRLKMTKNTKFVL